MISLVSVIMLLLSGLTVLAVPGARRIIFAYFALVGNAILAGITSVMLWCSRRGYTIPTGLFNAVTAGATYLHGIVLAISRGVQIAAFVAGTSFLVTIVAAANGWYNFVGVMCLIYASIAFFAFATLRATGRWFATSAAATSNNWGYAFGVFSMSFVLTAMICLGLPHWFEGPAGTVLAMLWLLGYVGYLYGAILNSTAKWAPGILFASAILVVVATIWHNSLPQGTQSQRYLVSVIQKWDTQAGRYAAANELDVHFTEATILADTPVYTEVDVKNSNGDLIKKFVYVEDKSAEKGHKMLKAGTKVMVANPTVPVFAAEGREPLIYVKQADDYGQFVVETGMYFVPKRFTSESTAAPVGSPEVIQASHTDSSKVATTRQIAVGETVKVNVPANVEWFNTGVDATNRKLTIKVMSGEWRNHPNSGTNAGEGRSPYADQKLLVVPSAPLSSLVAKTDNKSFFVGNAFEGNAGSGTLRLALNDKGGHYQDNSGSLEVEITAIQ